MVYIYSLLSKVKNPGPEDQALGYCFLSSPVALGPPRVTQRTFEIEVSNRTSWNLDRTDKWLVGVIGELGSQMCFIVGPPRPTRDLACNQNGGNDAPEIYSS